MRPVMDSHPSSHTSSHLHTLTHTHQADEASVAGAGPPRGDPLGGRKVGGARRHLACLDCLVGSVHFVNHLMSDHPPGI